MKDQRQEKIDLIRGLLDGNVKPDQIDDKLEAFRDGGKEVAWKVNSNHVTRDEFIKACNNNPKDSSNTLGSIIVHGDDSNMFDEYYV